MRDSEVVTQGHALSVRQSCAMYQHPAAIWRGWNEAGESLLLSVVILDLPAFDSTGTRMELGFFNADFVC